MISIVGGPDKVSWLTQDLASAPPSTTEKVLFNGANTGKLVPAL